MIGAIIGDIVGSRFEFNNHRSTEFELFHKDCSYTDDTICTVAVAEWLLQDTKYLTAEQLTKIMRKWCRLYPNPAGGYGGRFSIWIWQETIGGYDSFGNGSAMRVSPVAWAFNHVSDVLRAAKISAEISHNHPEGIKGAQSVADAILMLRKGIGKDAVIEHIRDLYEYDCEFNCKELSRLLEFNETCQGTIPVCLQCLQESTDFESAIRLAVSIGGDTDTIAAIVGSLAEACYGVPVELIERALAYLPNDMKNVITKFINIFGYGTEKINRRL
jgi:ADP-ribosyl-[dinitrogen reductase] hydrolase